MPSLAAIRAAVAAGLEERIDGLTAYPAVAGAVNVPAVVVLPMSADYVVAHQRGTVTYEFDLCVLAPVIDEGLGQDELDELVDHNGDRSIPRTVFAANDRSASTFFGLTSTDGHIQSMSEYGSSFESADIQHIGARLRLIVHTRGNQ